MAWKPKFNPNVTPQNEPIAGATMVANRAGGYVFPVGRWEALRRFLTIGIAGGTFYAREREMAKESYQLILECLKEDTFKTLELIGECSDKGLALKNDYALYALAVATLAESTSADGRRAAFNLLPKVARTGTHLFQFVAYREGLGGGWGELMCKTIARYYKETPLDALAFQVTKYQQRDGWSHRDLLRLSRAGVKPKMVEAMATTEVEFNNTRAELLRWIVDGSEGRSELETKKHGKRSARPPVNMDSLPRIVQGFELAKRWGLENATPSKMVALVHEYGLSREMIPTQYLDKPEVQEALLEKMPVHALVRNLGNFTKSGLLTPTSTASREVIQKLGKWDHLRKSRVHPFALFIALNTYKGGIGRAGRGGSSWVAVPRIIDALDDAMYACVQNLPQSGKGIVIGIDGSGSMEHQIVQDLGISVRAAAVVMALFTLKAEHGARVIGFSDDAKAVPISPKQRVDDAIATFEKYINATRTDCSLPIRYARAANWKDVAAFVTYTDNETWAGPIHPHQALREYRKYSGIEAKHVAVAMTATSYSIADETDAGSLNVVGFSADAAKVIGDFIQ